MKMLRSEDINTPEYWDHHQTAVDFGLRQAQYKKLCMGKSVLELGCGLSPFLSRSGMSRKVGLDFSEETCKKATKLYPSVTYVIGDALHAPFPDKSFDTVVAGELIEHLKDPMALIREMKRLATRRIVISTPNLEFDDPEHLWEFDQADMRAMTDGTSYTIHSDRFEGRSYIFAFAKV